MKEYIVTVGAADSGFTPSMPFVGKKFEGKSSTAFARLLLEIALLRCGFDISDKRTPITDPQELIYQSNRVGADCIVVISTSAFGSRKSFNDVCGGTVTYANGRHGRQSRELAEDICAKLSCVQKCQTAQCAQGYNGAVCPAVVIEMGYLTNFDEAKLMNDPDYLRSIAEHAVMGICEYFGMPYVLPSPIAGGDMRAEMGMRGKKIKLLQAALNSAGYTIDIDGVYGKNTQLAAKEFAINNMETDGMGTSEYNDLFTVTPKPHELGSKHCDVLYIQQKLIAKLYPSPDHGMLDNDTLSALNEYLTDTNNASAICDNGVSKEAMHILSAIGGGKPRLF